MSDYADNGNRTIYAAEQGGAYYIVANEYGYYRENSITTYGSTINEIFFAHNRVFLIENDAGDLYVWVDDLEKDSGLVQAAGPYTAAPHTGLVYMGEKLFFIPGGSQILYSLDRDNTISSVNLSALFSAQFPRGITTDGSSIFFVDNGMDSGKLYNPASILNSDIYLSTGLAVGVIYFRYVNGNLYIGAGNRMIVNSVASVSGYFSNVNSVDISPAAASTYCIDDDENIFAGRYNGGNFEIMKFDGAQFNVLKAIASGSGTGISLAPLRPGKLAVGINGSVGASGLYIYDWKNDSLKTITTAHAISSVYVTK